jgi:predicted PurR-regulated permease PerM
MSVLDHGMDTARSPEPLVPGWLTRLAAIGWRVLVTLALGLVIAVVVRQLAVVAAAIIVALILASTLAPFVQQRRARGWGRAKAAGVASLLGLLVVVGVVTAIVVVVVPVLIQIVSAFDEGIESVLTGLAQAGLSLDIALTLERISSGVRETVLDNLGAIVGAAANLVTIGILGGFLTYFLLVDGDRAWDWMLTATDGWRREALTEGGQRILDQLGGYILATMFTAITSAALALALMLVLQVPFAGALAVAVFIASFVPFVGRALAILAITSVTIASRGAVPAFALLALFVLGSIVLDRFASRSVSGRHLEMHPILAVIGLPIGFALGGLLGMIIILPILAVGQTVAGVLITTLGRDPGPVAPAPAPATGSGPAHAALPPAPDALHRDVVPVWLDRLGQWSWRGLIVVALFVIAAQVALLVPAIIMPVVIAVILAATLGPAAAALERRGLSPSVAAMAVTVGTGAVILGVLGITIASMVGPLADMVGTATEGAEASGGGAVGLTAFVAMIGGGLIAAVRSAVGEALVVVLVLLLGGFLTFYFIRDGRRVWRALTRLVPEDRRATLDAAGTRAADVLGGYMLGTAAISLFGAVTQLLIMVILGLPFALPLAVLAVFTGFIPYIGGFISTGIAFLVALAVGDQSDIVIMFVYTIVFNIVQGNFVTPLVYGKAVSLHPAIILLAVPVGSALAGIVGMFLVVPVAGVIATTWRAVLEVIDTGDGVPSLPPPPPDPAADAVPIVPATAASG